MFRPNLCKSHCVMFVCLFISAGNGLQDPNLFLFKCESSAQEGCVCVCVNIYFQENSLSFNCSNIFCLLAKVSCCPLKLSFGRKGQFWCFPRDGFHNDSLFCYCPEFDLSVFSVFHPIGWFQTQPHDRWCSAFDLGGW